MATGTVTTNFRSAYICESLLACAMIHSSGT